RLGLLGFWHSFAGRLRPSGFFFWLVDRLCARLGSRGLSCLGFFLLLAKLLGVLPDGAQLIGTVSDDTDQNKAKEDAGQNAGLLFWRLGNRSNRSSASNDGRLRWNRSFRRQRMNRCRDGGILDDGTATAQSGVEGQSGSRRSMAAQDSRRLRAGRSSDGAVIPKVLEHFARSLITLLGLFGE